MAAELAQQLLRSAADELRQRADDRTDDGPTGSASPAPEEPELELESEVARS